MISTYYQLYILPLYPFALLLPWLWLFLFLCKRNAYLLLLAYYFLLEAFIAFLAKFALCFGSVEALGFARTFLAYAPVDIPARFAALLKVPFVPRRFILAAALPIQFLFCELVFLFKKETAEV